VGELSALDAVLATSSRQARPSIGRSSKASTKSSERMHVEPAGTSGRTKVRDGVNTTKWQRLWIAESAARLFGSPFQI
jgi:hypothetical protein